MASDADFPYPAPPKPATLLTAAGVFAKVDLAGLYTTVAEGEVLPFTPEEGKQFEPAAQLAFRAAIKGTDADTLTAVRALRGFAAEARNPSGAAVNRWATRLVQYVLQQYPSTHGGRPLRKSARTALVLAIDWMMVVMCPTDAMPLPPSILAAFGETEKPE